MLQVRNIVEEEASYEPNTIYIKEVDTLSIFQSVQLIIILASSIWTEDSGVSLI
jgi:hypothetical protein